MPFRLKRFKNFPNGFLVEVYSPALPTESRPEFFVILDLLLGAERGAGFRDHLRIASPRRVLA